MTTTITPTTTQTQSTPTVDTGVSTPASQTQKASSLEDTVSALANSLSGFTSRCMEQPTSHPRMFARMERLVDSIARLVDAIANYRSSTKPDAAGATQQAPALQQPATPLENDASPTPPSPESPTPTPEPTPTVGTAPESEVVEHPVAPPADPKIELGAQLPPTGGFLWKPVSDKNGDLAVLLPKQYTGRVKQVRVLNADGTKVLAKGRYSGVGNGDREHYRFNKPGSGYPDGAIVLIEMENGALRHLKIKDTAKRTER